MSLSTIGDAKGRKQVGTHHNRIADILDAASQSTVEQLEIRRLLAAQVIAPGANGAAEYAQQSAPLAPKPSSTFFVNGGANPQWSQNSTVTPYTQNDLVLNVAPFDDQYSSTRCCEGGGGTFAINLLTNGITQNQTGPVTNPSQPAPNAGTGTNDPSNNINVLSNLNNGWNASYALGTTGGAKASSTGYDINEIDVISGHQDYRVQIRSVDIQVQYVGSTQWVTLSGGVGFSFNNDSLNNLGKGSAQMAITEGGLPANGDINSGTPIAKNVQNVKFIALSDVTWFREFVVTGKPSATLPPAPTPASGVTASFSFNTGAVTVTWTAGQNESLDAIQRSSDGGATFQTIAGVPAGTTSYTDNNVNPNTTYFYRIQGFNSAGGGTTVNSPVSNSVTIPALAVEAHYYQLAYWEGQPTVSTGALKVDFNWPNGGPAGIPSNNNSTVFTGKLTTEQAGTYLFVSNSDDDGYLYVDGVLVSEDPGGHGQRNAGLSTNGINGGPVGKLTPISLAANTQYDYVMMQHQGGGGAGSHILWVTPSTGGNGPYYNAAGQLSVTPVVVPTIDFNNNTILTATSDAPAQPSGLTVTGTTSNWVNFSFTADNNAVVHYILQRSADNGQTWQTVNQIDPWTNNYSTVNGSFQQNAAGITTPVTNIVPANVQIQDPTPAQGVTYQYRVGAVNYDGVVPGPTTTLTLATTSDTAGLAAGTYFLQYTWMGDNNTVGGETTPDPVQFIVLPSAGDIAVTVPAAPNGVGAANVYIGTSAGSEHLVGSAVGGGQLLIKTLPSSSAATLPVFDGTFTPSTTVTATAPNIALPPNRPQVLGVEAHYYNYETIGDRAGGTPQQVTGFFMPTEATYVTTDALPNAFTQLQGGAIDRDLGQTPADSSGLGVAPQTPDSTPYSDVTRVHNEHYTSVFTGQIRPAISGLYTFISNTDDDGYFWVNDKLVSSDPGGHGQQIPNGSLIHPMSLQAGTLYNFVFEMQQQGGGAGFHALWVEPPVSTGSTALGGSNADQSGATITLADSDSGNYNGFTISITNGTGANQSGVITGIQTVGGHRVATVVVTQNGGALLWTTVPDSSSKYNIAFVAGIPIANTGGHDNGGFLQYMDVPHHETTSSSGVVTDFTLNFNDPTDSAAGNFAVTNVDPKNGVSMTWSDQSPSELWFQIQRSTDGVNWTNLARTPMDSNSFVDATGGSAFGSPTGFQYRIRGENFDGAGPWSQVAATNNTKLNTPAVTSIVQSDAGSLGLTFSGQNSNAGGFELQDSTNSGTTWVDVAPSSPTTPLPNLYGTPNQLFDYLVTGLDPTKTYNFRVRNLGGPNASAASAFSAASAAVMPNGAVNPESFGTPGSQVGGFTTQGDLQLNGGAKLTGAGIPLVNNPTTPLSPSSITEVNDLANPTTAGTVNLITAPVTPTAPLTIATQQDSNSLQHGIAPGPSYYIRYTWLGANGGETASSPEQTILPFSGYSDVLATAPTAPAGAGKANIYISSEAPGIGGVPGDERLAGSVSGGQTLTIRDLPATTAAKFPTTSTAGLQTGTYYVTYSWLNSSGGQTATAPETTVVIPAGSADYLSITAPQSAATAGAPSGASKANIFVGTAPGSEHLAGTSNVSSGSFPALTVGALPATSAAGIPVINSAGLPAGTYYVQYAWNDSGTYPGGSDTASSPEQTVVLTSLGDIQITGPTQAGASGAEIFLSNSSLQERFAGTVAPGKTLVINAVPNSSQGAAPVATPSAPATLSTAADSTSGLTAGTYYVEYTWNSGRGETDHSPEQSITISSGQDIVFTAPTQPVGASNANVYVSNTPGGERQVNGSVNGGKSLNISSLPGTGAAAAPTFNTITNIATYFTPANALQLNNNTNGQTASAFNKGENINGFTTSFDFQFTGDDGADGITFTIQPNSQTALGGGGGNMGYQGIGHSVAVVFKLYNGQFTGLGVNGNMPDSGATSVVNYIDLGPSGFNFHSFPNQDVFNATLVYDNAAKTLKETVKDLNNNATFTTTYNIDIVKTVGMPAAYVGFTGASGGAHAEKDILNWTFNGGPQVGPVSNDVITGTTGNDTITITADPNGTAVDWTLNGGPVNTTAINDPNGLTINGNGGSDTITFTGANSLTNLLNLNSGTGTFTVNGLPAIGAAQKVDVGRSTVYVNYPAGQSPVAAIQGYLKSGYANGAWTGFGIVSSAAKANAQHSTAVGYADSANHLVTGQPANTVEIKYTLVGDTNLDGKVDFTDFSTLAAGFNQSNKTWDKGDFDYNGTVDFTDFSGLAANFNKTLTTQVVTAASSVSVSPAIQTNSGLASSVSSGTLKKVKAKHHVKNHKHNGR